MDSFYYRYESDGVEYGIEESTAPIPQDVYDAAMMYITCDLQVPDNYPHYITFNTVEWDEKELTVYTRITCIYDIVHYDESDIDGYHHVDLEETFTR